MDDWTEDWTPQERERLLTELFDPSPVAKRLGRVADVGFALADRWSDKEWQETPQSLWKTVPLHVRAVATAASWAEEAAIWLNRRRADRKVTP